MISFQEQLLFLAEWLDETGNELSVEERNLFSIAFKNLITQKSFLQSLPGHFPQIRKGRR